MIGIALIYIFCILADCGLMAGSIWLYGWCGWSFWWIILASLGSSGNVAVAERFISKGNP